MELGRRDFIGGVAAAGSLSAFGIPASGRIARIGHMTDTHVVGKIESLARVRMAQELFKAKRLARPPCLQRQTLWTLAFTLANDI